MTKKVYIQPGVWVILISLGLVGAYFGITTLKNNGSLGKISSVVAPSGNQSSKAVKIDGKTPVVVALNTWPGFAPGVAFNGGLNPTTSSRFTTEYGVPVQFIIMDNFDDSRNAWKAGKVDIICNTADVLPTEAPSMLSFGIKVFLQIDWSRGGDVMWVRQGINNVADLKGKTIAVDAFNALYQFLSSIRQYDGTPLQDKNGKITSHLSGLFYRNLNQESRSI